MHNIKGTDSRSRSDLPGRLSIYLMTKKKNNNMVWVQVKNPQQQRPKKQQQVKKQAPRQYSGGPKKQPQLMAATNAPLALAIERSKKSKPKPAITSRLSPCATRYASALCDPEGTPVGACVPWGFPIPSFKAKGFTRIQMVCGTTGFGFALFSAATASDAQAVLVTSATSVGGGSTVLNSVTNLANALPADLPYAAASFGANSISSRTVSMIGKIRYAGTEANRNGTIYGYEHPQHAALGGLTGNAISTSNKCYSARPNMDGSWSSVIWSGPSVPTETDFGTTTAFNNTAGVMVLMVYGTAGDKYDVEYYTHVEYTGGATQNTPSTGKAESDPEGYAHVIETIKGFTISTPFVSEMASTVYKAAVSGVKSFAVETLKSSISPTLRTGVNTRLLI